MPVQCDDHWRGDAEAATTLVVYGSYLHPRCRAAEQSVRELLHTLPCGLRLVFRHFPLASIAPGAQLAAELAEAAGAQGAFWPMHDELMAHARADGALDVHHVATRLGLDVVRIAAELRDRTHALHVAAHVQSGLASGVNGLPTAYINARRYTGPWSPWELRLALERAAPTDTIRAYRKDHP